MVSSRDDLWTKPQKPRPQKTKIYRKSIELLKSSAKIQKISDIRKFWWYFLSVLFFFYFSLLLFAPRCSVRTTSAGALPLTSWFYVGWHPMPQKRQRISRCLSYVHSAGLYPACLCLLLRNRIPLFIAFMRRSSMCGFISPPAPYPAGLTEGVSKLLPPPYQ